MKLATAWTKERREGKKRTCEKRVFVLEEIADELNKNIEDEACHFQVNLLENN
jgi:hypothetical protein